MNIKKIRKQLKKINTLFSAIEEEGFANSMERDLMKTYILSLYEQVISNKEVIEEVHVPKATKVEKKVHKAEVSESIFDETPQASKVKEEALETIVEQEYTAIKNGTPSPAPIESVIDLVEEDIPEPETVEEITPEIDERYDVLFQSENSNELSSRLSKLPIGDLNGAFGLNEKIFNINELFNGDNGSYQETIDALNSLSSMEEARNYLSSEVVDRFDWLEDRKIKKAANFIRVIHRRYM